MLPHFEVRKNAREKAMRRIIFRDGRFCSPSTPLITGIRNFIIVPAYCTRFRNRGILSPPFYGDSLNLFNKLHILCFVEALFIFNFYINHFNFRPNVLNSRSLYKEEFQSRKPRVYIGMYRNNTDKTYKSILFMKDISNG